MKIQIGGCCACSNIVSGSSPMLMDMDPNIHDYTPSTGAIPDDEWYCRVGTYGTPSYSQYELRYNSTAVGDERWTNWLSYTNMIDVKRKPNPVSSGIQNALSLIPSQGFFPKSHFMRPTRVTGFSATGGRPSPVGASLLTIAAKAWEWKFYLNGERLSNNPEQSDYPLGSLNLPFFAPDPEGTPNENYRYEGSEVRIEIRFLLHDWVSHIKIPMNGTADGYSPTVLIGYEFENGFEVGTPTQYQIAAQQRDGVGWYHGNGDPDAPLRKGGGPFVSTYNYWYNLGSCFYNGALFFPTFSFSGTQWVLSATGFKAEGDDACPFGDPIYYAWNGADQGTHPSWGYQKDGPTTFHRHLRDRLASQGDYVDNDRVIFSPYSKTVNLVPGHDWTLVPYRNREVGVNGVRRDSNYFGRVEPADPYWPP